MRDLTLARFFNAPTDPRITADFLNLVPDDGPLSAERPSDGDSLHKLLDEGFLVEAAKQLYDQGHPLAFELAYEKTEIDPVLVVSFPFYQFERKRWWKDISISTPPGNALTHISSAPSSAKPVGTHPADGSGVFGPDLGQAAFEELVRQFGAPIQTPLSKKDPSVLPGPPLAYLITGANGMLGCQLLSRFLCHTNSHVYCIIRGDPLVRLQSAFKRFQQDERHLEDALTDGRLHLMQTGDLCAGQLGLTPVEYTTLLDHVDRIIHLAWPVNFNLPLKDFLPFLACTRGLVDFCYSAKKLVRFFFIGSYASTFNYLAERVPENELPLNVSYSLSQGYAVAKLIAEHSLIKTHRNDPSAFRLSIIRVGQVCGDTVTGFWSQDELMPMVIASLPALRALPALFPPVAWIPSDVCANTLFDLATTDQAPDRHLVHVANPVALPWPETAAEIFRFTLGAPAKLVEFGEYVQLIKAYTEPLPVRRLLPYFECLIETMPDRYAVLDVAVSMQYSKSLAACPPISGTLLQRIVQRVLDEQSPQQVAEPPTTNHRSPIFIFGPLLSVDGLVPDADILHRILNHAEESRKGLSDVSKLDGSLLFKQLTTLAMQLGTVESLAKDGIRPHAVLGYCFGEYAAAVTAGILPEVVAVDLLVRRALSLRSQERAGAMLNVFCDLRTIRPILACLPSPPSIAIVAGPSHVVLSGSVSQVQSAQAELQHRRVRTFLVDTPVPFHSALIDNAISQFQPPVYDAKTTSVAYISGVTASTISGHLLGVNYWLRHMRETVNFYGSMVFVRRTLPGHPVVDVGPHNTLSKIISRYEWSEVRVYSADTARSIPVTSTQRAAVSMTDSDTLSATTRGQTPGTSKEQIQVAEANTIALQVLKELFGYEPTVDLLRQSLHAIGLQSLDFIRFSDCYGAKTGLFLSLSAYIADTPLENVVSSAMKSAYSQPKHQISNT
ncbi:unnamed protein product [Cyclocybe aegerita]|uniref:Malonyl-CoA:ACP transacylase (MAT) domain-containing protein n=1 Tax=Cyclocybe aegerita TaxID=1973307 RepID=A0A8S0WH32_CYCAE|nr:unnamed protein product [Cyclocybe aegerita]